MKPIHFGMMMVPMFFLLLLALVAYASFYRESGVRYLDASKIQEIRFSRSEKQSQP